MNAIQFSRFGPAPDVAEVVALPDPEAPAAGEVLAEFVAAPINPSDLMMMLGQYGIKPPLPAVAGGEGIGRVVQIGAGVTNVKPGDLVSTASKPGTWRERVILDARALFPLPPGDPLQLAMLTANPATAHIMLSDFVELKDGDWIAQNAANSGVGGAVITLSRRRGLRTLNVVRREELIAPLRETGADIVLVDGPDLAQRAREALEAAGSSRSSVKLAFDAVAGTATARLSLLLADGGTIVNYGALSGEPCQVLPQATIFRNVTLRGFWLITWFRAATPAAIARVYGELAPLVASGALQTPVEATYPLSRARDALAHAAREGRGGKILFVKD